MMQGILGFKGRIQLSLAPEMSSLVTEADPAGGQLENKNKQIQWLADRIDQQIHQHFQLWPTHFIAHDLLHSSHSFSAHYTPSQKAQFMERMKAQLATLEFQSGVPARVEEIFLENYANALRTDSTCTQAPQVIKKARV
jgi:hypothetical protein